MTSLISSVYRFKNMKFIESIREDSVEIVPWQQLELIQTAYMLFIGGNKMYKWDNNLKKNQNFKNFHKFLKITKSFKKVQTF